MKFSIHYIILLALAMIATGCNNSTARKQFLTAFLCPVLILTGLGALMVGLKII